MTDDRSDAQASGSSDMGVDVNELRKVAEAAWHEMDESTSEWKGPAAMDHVATFDPPTVLKLLALLDAKEREVAELRQALSDAYLMTPVDYLREHPHFAEKVETMAAHLREMAQLQARIVELEQSLESSANPTSTTIQATLRAKIDVVRSIHKRDQSVQIHAWTQWYCAADGDPWPCKTIRALDGE